MMHSHTSPKQPAATDGKLHCDANYDYTFKESGLMIIDTLENASPYAGLGAGFDLAFAFLRSDKPTTAEPERYDLDGDRVFALVQQYTTNPFETSVWEAHRHYADVQLVVSGQEQMGYAHLDTMTIDKAYDAENDFTLYRGDGVLLPFNSGTFAVFFPQDVHMPCVTHGSPSEVRKVVVKIRVSA
jgi:YhcH/YjgK/YiaL family protein